MSTGIRPKCHEQCPKAHKNLSKSVFIDTKKPSEDFWKSLLQEKCPEELCDVSEGLLNDSDLTPDDFLSSIDQETSIKEHVNRTQYESDQQKFPSHEFKTPATQKSRQFSHLDRTPNLFTQDSQEHVTPNNIPGSHTVEREESLVGGLVQVHRPWESLIKTPETLEQLITEKQSHRPSLPMLDVSEARDDTIEWTESMATPPRQKDVGINEGELMDTKIKMEEKGTKVARTLFSKKNLQNESDNTSLEVTSLPELEENSELSLMPFASENTTKTTSNRSEREPAPAVSPLVSSQEVKSFHALPQSTPKITKINVKRRDKRHRRGRTKKLCKTTSKGVDGSGSSEQSSHSPLTPDVDFTLCNDINPSQHSQKQISSHQQYSSNLELLNYETTSISRQELEENSTSGLGQSLTLLDDTLVSCCERSLVSIESQEALEKPSVSKTDSYMACTSAEFGDSYSGIADRPNGSKCCSNTSQKASFAVSAVHAQTFSPFPCESSTSGFVLPSDTLDAMDISIGSLSTSFEEALATEVDRAGTSDVSTRNSDRSKDIPDDKPQNTSRAKTHLGLDPQVTEAGPSILRSDSLLKTSNRRTESAPDNPTTRLAKVTPSCKVPGLKRLSRNRRFLYPTPRREFTELTDGLYKKMPETTESDMCRKATETPKSVPENSASGLFPDNEIKGKKPSASEDHKLDNMDNNPDCSTLDTHKPQDGEFVGFRTGSGKTVDISEKALLEAAKFVASINKSCDQMSISTPGSVKKVGNSCDNVSNPPLSPAYEAGKVYDQVYGPPLPGESTGKPQASVLPRPADNWEQEEGTLGAESYANEPLFDMDALSQFPVDEIESPEVRNGDKDIGKSTPKKNYVKSASKGTSDLSSFQMKCVMDTGKNSGFMTSSGKKLLLSEDALRKIKAELDQLGQDLNNGLPVDDSLDDSLVSHADALDACGESLPSRQNNKPVNPDTNTVLVDDEPGINKVPGPIDWNRDKDDCSELQGFHTASGVKLKASERSLQSARRMWESCSVSDDQAPRHNEFINQCNMSPTLHLTRELSDADSIVKTQVKKPPGFKTASGKKIDISKEALKIARELLEDVDLNYLGDEFDSFKSGNHSVLSEFGTSSEMISDTKNGTISVPLHHNTSTVSMRQYHELGHHGNVKKPPFSGFQTASGKKVEISEESLHTARDMLRRLDMDDHMSCQVGKNVARTRSVEVPSIAGKTSRQIDIEDKNERCRAKMAIRSRFQTASGKKVEISEECLKKARETFKQIDMGDQINPQDRTSRHVNVKPQIVSGFQTASGKKVKISEESLKKATERFKQIDMDDEIPPQDKTGRNVNVKAQTFSGFQTASGKKVEISEECLKKARETFKQIDMDDQINPQDKTCRNVNVKSQTFSGFQTESGKRVEISEESLKKARETFKQIDSEDLTLPREETERNVIMATFSGFQTASGKKVEISAEALKKARDTFQQINMNDLSEEKPSPFPGFHTASGKKVEISEESLKRARETFQQLEGEADRNAHDESAVTFSGFQTASGKKVEISKESLKKARETFKQIDSEDLTLPREETERNVIMATFSGFQTASGKKVEISEESLEKARKVLGEVEGIDCLSGHTFNTRSEKGCLEKRDSVATDQLVPPSRSSGGTLDIKKETVSPKSIPQSTVRTPNIPAKNPSVHANRSLNSGKDVVKGAQTPVQTPTAPRLGYDEMMHREIQESSAALQEDDSTTDFAGFLCDEISIEKAGNFTATAKTLAAGHVKVMSSGRQSRSSHPSDLQLGDKGSYSNSSVQRSQSAPIVMQGSEVPSAQPRRHMTPQTSTPSGVLFNRRSRKLTPPMKPRITEPASLAGGNTNTKSDTRRLFARKPVSTIPSPSSVPGHSVKRKQFATPFRAHASTASAAENSMQTPSVVAPDRKRPRVSGPLPISQPVKAAAGGSTKPCLGYLSKLRNAALSRPTLKQYVGNATPGHYTSHELDNLGVSGEVQAVTSANAGSFRFDGRAFCSEHARATEGGIRTEDGGLVRLGSDGRVGLEEIEAAFLGTPGVDPSLVCTGWVANHFRWIVWKLAALEVSFPQCFAGRCLTPDWVMCQLKYRYDLEIDRSHRSALKKVLERDDASTKTMVLCVSGVNPPDLNQENGTSNKITDDEATPIRGSTPLRHQTCGTITVTDGWYSVQASLDRPLDHLVRTGQIHVGQKLCVNGAELIGYDQPVSPLEAPNSLMLRLHANSTRRAQWNARLGFQRHSHPFPLPLGSLFADGGAVGCVDVVVLRTYPLEFMEKLSDGTTVFRCARAEDRESNHYHMEQERAREDLLSRVQREIESEAGQTDSLPKLSKRMRRSCSTRDVMKLTGGKEINEALNSAPDPSTLEECLDCDQLRSLQEYRRTLMEEQRRDMEERFQQAWQKHIQGVSLRSVVPLLKLRIGNYHDNERDKTVATLSIWRPSEEIMQMLTEGSRLKIYHLSSSPSRYRGGSALQLSASRSTRYQSVASEPDTLKELYTPRQAACFFELDQCTVNSEVDLVGVVVHVKTHEGSSLETLYLADHEHSMVAVKFWGGLKTYCVEDLAQRGSLVSCSNLVVRLRERHKCPVLSFNELSVLSLKPRNKHLKVALEQLKMAIDDMEIFLACSKQPLEDAMNTPNRPSQQGVTEEDRTSPSSIWSRKSPSVCYLGTPAGRMSGQCKRKLLESVSEPPPLSTINILASAGVRREFKRPRKVS